MTRGYPCCNVRSFKVFFCVCPPCCGPLARLGPSGDPNFQALHAVHDMLGQRVLDHIGEMIGEGWNITPVFSWLIVIVHSFFIDLPIFSIFFPGFFMVFLGVSAVFLETSQHFMMPGANLQESLTPINCHLLHCEVWIGVSCCNFVYPCLEVD